jgi:anaerobic C4-dicarboxylate transporter
MLINVTLVFFSLLIAISFFNILFPVLKEGATGSCDLEKDPIYLAKLNAAKLKAMEDEFGEAKKLKEDIKILTNLVENNAKNIQAMGEQLQDKSSELINNFEMEP